MKIRSLLLIGLGTILGFVILLGLLTFWQTRVLWLQTEGIYLHPMQVRHAIGELKSDVLIIHRGMKDVLLLSDNNEVQTAVQEMDAASADAIHQIETIRNQYLGPRENVDMLASAFIKWNTIRQETLRLLRSGKYEEAVRRTMRNGIGGAQTIEILEKIKTISDFSWNKADDFYQEAESRKNALTTQLIILTLLMTVSSALIIFIVIHRIRKPIGELNRAASQFAMGNLDTRSRYHSGNELGELSKVFNKLADAVQQQIQDREDIARISQVMLRHESIHSFFSTLLTDLMMLTNSQTGAVYLLNNEKERFECFVSSGMTGEIPSFGSNPPEGELSLAIATGTIRYHRNLPEGESFIFTTTAGSYKPSEIITIPFRNQMETCAAISLSSLSNYSERSIRLLENLWPIMTARINGILTMKQVQEFSEQINLRNQELEAQKQELSSQAQELQIQNRELEAQKQKLDEASRLKTSFLSNMSHELRTPLNSVIALSGVLHRRLASQIPEEEFSYLKVIERNGRHLLELINDILDISRIESGRESIESGKFDMNELVAEVVALIKPQASQKNIGLIQHLNGGEIFLSSDMVKCRHIIQNLVSNAVKFTEQGQVEIRCSSDQDWVNVSVKDTGIGISGVHLPFIFDEFRQADGSTSRKYGGTGLGLAIARKYALLLGGNITVTSTPGAGSEFILSLPVLREQYTTQDLQAETVPSTTITTSIKSTNTANTGGRILIVEDSEPAVVQLRDILEEKGFTITIAGNGNEALALIDQQIPDAIILDLMMPEVDGFQFLRVLRENVKTSLIPVIILTAKHITREELSFLKRNNIKQVIQKGDINRLDLLEAVQGMLAPPATVTKTPATVQKNLKETYSILVVEDNPDNMITVKALLTGKYKVIEAVNGQEGIDMAGQYKPDLILMDIALPGINGIEAFKMIRSNPELWHIPIIALTASAMLSDREAILAHGFEAYIAKPIDESLFFDTLNTIIHG